jgi:hypothetical protein
LYKCDRPARARDRVYAAPEKKDGNLWRFIIDRAGAHPYNIRQRRSGCHGWRPFWPRIQMPQSHSRARWSALFIALVPIGLLLAALAIGAAPATAPHELIRPSDGKAQPFDPTDAYDVRPMRGWTVRVNRKLTHDQPDLAKQTLELLDMQLYQITRVVPAPALKDLRSVTIWVEKSDPLFPCMCYHASVEWVRGHGLNPEKAHGVELSNPSNFLSWTKIQPWMVLHELSHAYHDQFLPGGFGNADVKRVYEFNKNAKRYDSVLYALGGHRKAYAMTNAMEYFAECSEAFFGTNDFYPFVRCELQQSDPEGYALMMSAWGAGK